MGVLAIGMVRNEMTSGFDKLSNQIENAAEEIKTAVVMAICDEITQSDLLEFTSNMADLIIDIHEEGRTDKATLEDRYAPLARKICGEVRRQLERELLNPKGPDKDNCLLLMQYGMRAIRGLVITHGVLQVQHDYSPKKLIEDMRLIYKRSDRIPGLANLVGQFICTPMMEQLSLNHVVRREVVRETRS